MTVVLRVGHEFESDHTEPSVIGKKDTRRKQDDVKFF